MTRLFYVLVTVIGLIFNPSGRAHAQEKIKIYRWNIQQEWVNDWVDAREDEEDFMQKSGYTHRTFVCYLFRTRVPGTLALYRWVKMREQEWVTMREGETMNGYSSPVLLGFAYPDPQANTMPINEWRLEKDGDWVTVPESASNDMVKFGYSRKRLLGYTPQ